MAVTNFLYFCGRLSTPPRKDAGISETKMKKTLLFILLILSFAYSCEKPDGGSTGNDGKKPAQMTERLNLATFNIRYATSGDTGVRSWASRKASVVATIKDNGFDVVGFQEVLANQQDDLKDALKDYIFYFVGRDDGTNGEAVGIGYRKSRLSVVDYGRFWLSPTPEKPSNAQQWGGPSRKRVAVWIKFKDLSTGKMFYYMTTHLEVNQEYVNVREKSAELIIAMEAKINKDALPFFVVGDMNPNSPIEAPMQKLRKVFSDSFQEANKAGVREGPTGTYNGFNPDADMENKTRGDYIFAKGRYDLKRYRTIDTKFSGQYPSDHLPVMITAIL